MLPSFSCMEDKARELQNLLLRCCGMRIPLMPEPQLSLEGAGRRKCKCSKSSPAQTSPEVVEKKERRERETDAESPQEPAKDAWRGGGKLGKQRQALENKAGIQMEPSRPRCLAVADVRIPFLILPFPSLPDREQLRGVSAAPKPPSAPFFSGFAEENKAAVTGMAGWEEFFQKGSKGGAHPKFLPSLALSASLYQHPLISVPFSAWLRFPFALFNPRFSGESRAGPPPDRIQPSGNSSL